MGTPLAMAGIWLAFIVVDPEGELSGDGPDRPFYRHLVQARTSRLSPACTLPY